MRDDCYSVTTGYFFALTNKTPIAFAEDEAEALRKATRYNMVDYAITYGEFMYQAGICKHPRRVVFKIENCRTKWHSCTPLSSQTWSPSLTR